MVDCNFWIRIVNVDSFFVKDNTIYQTEGCFVTGFLIGFIFIILDLAPIIFLTRKSLDFGSKPRRFVQIFLSFAYSLKLILVIAALYFILKFYQISFWWFSLGVGVGLVFFCGYVIRYFN